MINKAFLLTILSLFLLIPRGSAKDTKYIPIANDDLDFAPIYSEVFSPKNSIIAEEEFKKYRIYNSALYRIPIKLLSSQIDLRKDELFTLIDFSRESISTYKIKDHVHVIFYHVGSTFKATNFAIIPNDDTTSCIGLSKNPPSRSRASGFTYKGKIRDFKYFKIVKTPLKDISADDPIRKFPLIIFQSPPFIKKTQLDSFEITVFKRKVQDIDSQNIYYNDDNFYAVLKTPEGKYQSFFTSSSILDVSNKHLISYDFGKSNKAFSFFDDEQFTLVFYSPNHLEKVVVGGNLDRKSSER